MKDNKKKTKSVDDLKLYAYDPVKNWDGKFKVGMAVLSRKSLNTNGRDVAVYEGETEVGEGIVYVIEAVKAAPNGSQKIKLTTLDTQIKKWFVGNTFVPVQVFKFNKFHELPLTE